MRFSEYLFSLFLFILIVSCKKEKRIVIHENYKYSVIEDRYKIEILKNGSTPLFQKIYNKETGILIQVDSIIGDSMYSYANKTLTSKGLWALGKNKTIVYKDWIFQFYDGRLWMKVEIKNSNENTFGASEINQIIEYSENGEIDSTNSFFYTFFKNKENDLYLFVNSKDFISKRERIKIISRNAQNKQVFEKELIKGINNLDKESIYLNDSMSYEIVIFYLDSLNQKLKFDNQSIMQINNKDWQDLE